MDIQCERPIGTRIDGTTGEHEVFDGSWVSASIVALKRAGKVPPLFSLGDRFFPIRSCGNPACVAPEHLEWSDDEDEYDRQSIYRLQAMIEYRLSGGKLP